MSEKETKTTDEQQTGAPSIDLHRVLLEIEDEVRAKRASGELPAELERELDMVFARFAPPGVSETDFDALLERAGQQSFIDLLAPNESNRPGVPHVKRVVQKTVRWYLRYVVEQVGGFAHTITKAVRVLGDRVKNLEQSTLSAEESAAILHDAVDTAEPWAAEIVAALKGVEGRVLHARCARGTIVGRLQEAGVDAYGVDPASDFVAAGTVSGLDLRPDDERQHLRLLAPGTLAGLVLSASTDYLPRGAQVELIDLASLTLAKGGVPVVVSSNPVAWDRSHDPVEADMSPGRPMHAATWQRLLTDRGFTDIEVSEGEVGDRLSRLAGTDEAATTFNANVEKLNALLFPPTSSLIVARR